MRRQRDEDFVIFPSDSLYSPHFFFKTLEGLMSACAVLDFIWNTNSYELIHFLFYLALITLCQQVEAALWKKLNCPKGDGRKEAIKVEVQKILNLGRGKDFSTTLFLLAFNCQGSTSPACFDLIKALSGPISNVQLHSKTFFMNK